MKGINFIAKYSYGTRKKFGGAEVIFASPGPMFQADIRSIVSLFGAAKELYQDPEKSALGDWRPELRAWLRVAGAQVKQNFERGGYPGGIWTPIKKDSVRKRQVRKNDPWPPLTDVGKPTKDANWVEKTFTKNMTRFQNSVDAAEKTLREAQENKDKWEELKRIENREANKRAAEEKRKADRAKSIDEQKLRRLGRNPLEQADNAIKRKNNELAQLQKKHQYLSSATYHDLIKKKDYKDVPFTMTGMYHEDMRKQRNVVADARLKAEELNEEMRKKSREVANLKQARDRYASGMKNEEALSSQAKQTRTGAQRSDDFVHHTQKNLFDSDRRKYDKTIAEAKKKLSTERMRYTKLSRPAMEHAKSTQTWRGLSGAASNVVEGKYKGVSMVRVGKLMAEFGVRSGPGGIPYASAMEYGTNGRPSRPYMVLSEPTMRALEGYVEQGIYARLEGARHFRDWWE